MSRVRTNSIFDAPPQAISLVFVVSLLMTGCRDYGIMEGDSPEIIALKKRGAEVTGGAMGFGQTIKLKDTWADDDDMVHFEKLPEVVSVDLSGTYVTDEGLKHLASGSKKLAELQLDETEVTDKGIESLQELSQLSVLSLSGTKITDKSLAMLAENHSKLRDLRLVGCAQITNEGLKSIAQLPALQRLLLADCKQITDAGLKHLMGKPGMQIIHLMNTGCTNAAVEKLATSTGAFAVVNAEGQPAGALGKFLQQGQ